MQNTLTPPTGTLRLPAHVHRRHKPADKPAAKPGSRPAKVVFKPASGDDTTAPINNRKQPMQPAQPRTVTNSSNKLQAYTGAELKPNQGRPGSLDFLALPSLIGSTRHYRAGYAPATIAPEST